MIYLKYIYEVLEKPVISCSKFEHRLTFDVFFQALPERPKKSE